MEECAHSTQMSLFSVKVAGIFWQFKGNNAKMEKAVTSEIKHGLLLLLMNLCINFK